MLSAVPPCVFFMHIVNITEIVVNLTTTIFITSDVHHIATADLGILVFVAPDLKYNVYNELASG